MNLTDRRYFEAYFQSVGHNIEAWHGAFDFNAAAGDLGYRTVASAVYSSNIEGNPLDFNSFMNRRQAKAKLKAHKDVAEIENLIAAYDLARQSPLTEANFLRAHGLLSKTLLIKSKRGRYRNERVGIFSERGLVYVAVEPEYVAREMAEFFDQIAVLAPGKLTLAEAFYHASLAHLRLAHIHPFADGNGRAARLLEKWLLTTLIGAEAWQIPSEKYYWDHRADYYRHINLGVNYYALDYSRCLPFLEMLASCLKSSRDLP